MSRHEQNCRVSRHEQNCRALMIFWDRNQRLPRSNCPGERKLYRCLLKLRKSSEGKEKIVSEKKTVVRDMCCVCYEETEGKTPCNHSLCYSCEEIMRDTVADTAVAKRRGGDTRDVIDIVRSLFTCPSCRGPLEY